MKKIKVGICFGGNSCEHDVSCMTAKSILKYIDRDKFEVWEVFVDKNGKFDEEKLNLIDVAFLAFHGENYEDGKFQSLLDKKNIRYTGSGSKSSAINMDKAAQKKYFHRAGLDVVEYLTILSSEPWVGVSKRVVEKFGYPCVVKPLNAGSSIAVTLVEEKKNLSRAIDEAGKINNQILIERAVKGLRELEVGVLGNDELLISDPGEVLSGGEFYSYETKYFKPYETTVNAINLTAELIETIKDWSQKAYRATDCRGYARIDFFLDQNNQLFINEINSLPGFTDTSMYPKLMEATGISYKSLITNIIELAME